MVFGWRYHCFLWILGGYSRGFGGSARGFGGLVALPLDFWMPDGSARGVGCSWLWPTRRPAVTPLIDKTESLAHGALPSC